MGERKKILITASGFSHMRHFHLAYLQALHERGFTVHAACGGEREDLPWADRTFGLTLEKRMASPRNFRASRALRKLIRAEGYDLIITHTSLAAFFTRLALVGLRGRPRVINMVHGYLFDDGTPAPRRAVLLAAEKLTARYTDLILTMNRWDYEAARRYRLAGRVENVPGVGVDFALMDRPCQPPLRLPEGAFAVLYGAEFSPRKSQQVLIRALAELPENVYLLLPGEGELLDECRALAAELGLADRVLFPGWADTMGPWYALADAAASASRSEGLPFNIMEAMHRGLPVAASAVKGHEDLIEDGWTGLLYPYGDVAACAGCIRKLMDPETARRLGAQARQAAERYRLERVFPQVMEQYLSML